MRNGFFDLNDGIFTGLGISSLNKSSEGRNALLALFGGLEGLPSSVMKAKRSKPSIETDEHGATRSYRKTSPYSKESKEFGLSPIRGGGCQAGALSIFPQDIGRSMVQFYSNPGDVVFDPFAGHNSRMELCVRAGRHYIGCDLSSSFMDFNDERAAQLRREIPKALIELHRCDSRKIPVADGAGDVTITSPPYWDIEFYGDEPEQLGKRKTYGGFLKGLLKILKENFRVLKPGAYAAWFVNDFRRKGKMFFYHADLIRLGEEAGFAAHDILIVDFGRGFGDVFVNRMMVRRIIPKRHEYGIIFRKPEKS